MLHTKSLLAANKLGLNWRMRDIEQAYSAICGGRWFLGYRLLLGLSHDEAVWVGNWLNKMRR